MVSECQGGKSAGKAYIVAEGSSARPEGLSCELGVEGRWWRSDKTRQMWVAGGWIWWECRKIGASRVSGGARRQSAGLAQSSADEEQRRAARRATLETEGFGRGRTGCEM